MSDIRDGSFDPDASRAGRFTGLPEAEFEASPEDVASAEVRDGGAGVASVDEDESAMCFFERVSDQPDMDDAPLDTFLLEQPDTAQPCNPEDPVAGESSSSSDSESTSSTESDVLTDTNHQEASRVIGIPTPSTGTRFLMHGNTKMLHMIADGNSRVLLCGRMVRDVHQEATEVRFDSSVCSMCKRAAKGL